MTMVGILALSTGAIGCSDSTSGGGGTNAGGSSQGGSSDGGTNAGGTNAGGTNAGGTSHAGGSTQGGGGSAGEDPTAEITEPHDGDSFKANTSVPFAGNASDPQDGTLTGNSLVWVGDIAGVADPEGIGISGTFSFADAGDHTLTVTATDADGNTNAATITVHITE